MRKKWPVTKKGPGARGQGPENDERGYALLFVFLMAAIVGLYLYSQLPRVAFESERDKEQSLIDRGEQYKRAIQLYVAALKKYPQKIEDLENTNDKRYLRRRYIDPMTGKDEWRLIHVNAAGQLTDSLVQKPPCGALGQGSGTGPSASTSTSSTSSTGSTSTTGSTGAAGTAACTATPTTPGALDSSSGTATASGAGGATPGGVNDVNAAVLRRPSDVVGQAYTQAATADPNDPSTWAPITLAAPTGANGQPPSGAVGFNGGQLGQNPGLIPGQMGGNGQGGVVTGQAGAPGLVLPGQPGFNPLQNQFKIDSNGQLVPVTPPQPGQAANAQTGQTPGQPYVQAPVAGQPVGPSPFGPQQPGAANGVNPGTGIAPQNGATSAINQMLTNPTPMGAGALGASAGMTTGGIAGVASTFKGPSIKIYGTRQKYQEWEFIFSLNNQQNGASKTNNPLGGNQPASAAAGQNGTAGTGTAPGSTTGTSPGSTTTGN